MSHKGMTTWNCCSPLFRHEFNILKCQFKNMCHSNNWTLVSFDCGHHYISGYISDKSGNYVYFLKQDWDSDPKSLRGWFSDRIVFRTCKNRKDCIGGLNCWTTLDTMTSEITRLFKMQAVLLPKKVVAKRFHKKKGG